MATEKGAAMSVVQHVQTPWLDEYMMALPSGARVPEMPATVM